MHATCLYLRKCVCKLSLYLAYDFVENIFHSVLCSIPAPILFNSDDTYDLVIRINKGKWMVYDYSYIAIADGKTGSLLWTFNSSQAVMTSAITVHNKNKGQDGVLFISIGQSPEQSKTESETRKSMNKRGTCARGYVEEELKTCASSEQKRRKRHQNDQGTTGCNMHVYG